MTSVYFFIGLLILLVGFVLSNLIPFFFSSQMSIETGG